MHIPRPINTPRDDTFVTITARMINEFHLSGNELIIYAVIHGFSQDGKSRFHGSAAYLAFWCGCSLDTVYRNLKSLREKMLIDRNVIPLSKNGKCNYCEYWSIDSRINPTQPKKKK